MTDSAYSVQLTPPDITPFRAGNIGVDYITTLDSGRPGPHAMLSAVVHGNELCGAITLDFLLRENIRLLRGKLTLGFMNIAAYHSFDPGRPDAARFVDEDFNRLWATETLEGPRDSVELRRAREVRPIVDQIDFLLDIHSMQHPTVPLMLCGPTEKGRQLAKAIGFPMHIVSDVGHAAGKRMRDYAAFNDPASPKNALLVECGQHWAKSSALVAKETALRFLSYLELIDSDVAAGYLPAAPLPTARVIEVTDTVTIHSERFRFAEPYIGMEVIPKAGAILGWDGEQAVHTPYDDCILIMPSRRLYRGQTAVRLGRFVD